MSNITYLRVSFVLQVEHEKQLTHQALLRADTTEGITLKKEIMNIQLYLNILSKLLKTQYFIWAILQWHSPSPSITRLQW